MIHLRGKIISIYLLLKIHVTQRYGIFKQPITVKTDIKKTTHLPNDDFKLTSYVRCILCKKSVFFLTPYEYLKLDNRCTHNCIHLINCQVVGNNNTTNQKARRETIQSYRSFMVNYEFQQCLLTTILIDFNVFVNSVCFFCILFHLLMLFILICYCDFNPTY